jgi:hypothetical protein
VTTEKLRRSHEASDQHPIKGREKDRRYEKSSDRYPPTRRDCKCSHRGIAIGRPLTIQLWASPSVEKLDVTPCHGTGIPDSSQLSIIQSRSVGGQCSVVGCRFSVASSQRGRSISTTTYRVRQYAGTFHLRALRTVENDNDDDDEDDCSFR